MISASVVSSIPKTELHRAAFWLQSLGEDWRGDIPMRVHEKSTTTEGTLSFSPEFVGYIGYLECKMPDCPECRKQRAQQKNAEGWRNPEARRRATRAFRKLRRVAPREFDALYLYCINRMTITEIARALNQRAMRIKKEDRYDSVAVFLLLFSGIDKVVKFW